MGETAKYVLFTLNNEEFGLNIYYISSIEKNQKITNVPYTRDYMKGIVDIRGEIIPIIDLKERLGLGNTDFRNNPYEILIAEYNQMLIGLIVDVATDIIDIKASMIKPVQSDENGITTLDIPMSIAKMDDRIILILEMKDIVNEYMNGELEQSEEEINV